ncbi:MAG: response regulator, partial [Alphaproteobacteria bacterium]|nr:response regulator [Alphaproteobacteria bacterium]
GSPPPPPALAAPAAPASVADGGAAARRTVLLAEDNEVNALLASTLLRRLGHAVHVAANGRQALELLETLAVDLVLMDVHMPEMDGLSATRSWRQREAARGQAPLPIIALTASTLAEDRSACESAGMDDVLTKPLDLDKLTATLRRWPAAAA